MKSNLLLWVFICLVIYACGKAEIESGTVEDPEKKTTESSIVGSWELRELQGGFRPPNAQIYYSAGNGDIWEFTDSIYKHSFQGEFASVGTYTLTKDTALATGRLMDAFIMDGGNYKQQIYFEFNQDTLLLYDGQIAADGTIGKYVRVHAD
jgi:hypothetical protein